MSNYRLHIDLVVNPDQADSRNKSLDLLKRINAVLTEEEKTALKFRLGNDDDRINRNYIFLDENGHAKTNKNKLVDIV